MKEIKDVIEDEWKKAEKRFPLNRLGKLYPMSEQDSGILDSPPAVDAAVVHLAIDDSASFKDPLDRRIDPDLKGAYQIAGDECKPAIALTPGHPMGSP